MLCILYRNVTLNHFGQLITVLFNQSEMISNNLNDEIKQVVARNTLSSRIIAYPQHKTIGRKNNVFELEFLQGHTII